MKYRLCWRPHSLPCPSDPGSLWPWSQVSFPLLYFTSIITSCVSRMFTWNSVKTLFWVSFLLFILYRTDSYLSRVLGLFMINDPQQVSLRPVYLQASGSLGDADQTLLLCNTPVVLIHWNALGTWCVSHVVAGKNRFLGYFVKLEAVPIEKILSLALIQKESCLRRGKTVMDQGLSWAVPRRSLRKCPPRAPCVHHQSGKFPLPLSWWGEQHFWSQLLGPLLYSIPQLCLLLCSQRECFHLV